MEKTLNLDHFVALIGIDWADKKHDICLLDQTTQKIEYSVIQHSPKCIDDWVQVLGKRFNYQPIAISLELKSGPLVYALLKYPFITLVPIAPRALSKYREAFTYLENALILDFDNHTTLYDLAHLFTFKRPN